MKNSLPPTPSPYILKRWGILLFQLSAAHNQDCSMLSLFLSMGILSVCILPPLSTSERHQDKSIGDFNWNFQFQVSSRLVSTWWAVGYVRRWRHTLTPANGACIPNPGLPRTYDCQLLLIPFQSLTCSVALLSTKITMRLLGMMALEGKRAVLPTNTITLAFGGVGLEPPI